MTALIVAAAVIECEEHFLLTRRQQGVHLEGCWEFPGGKCHAGEALAACLVREMREELAVDVRVGAEVWATTHAYPDRSVELHFFECALQGEPVPQMGQEMRWVRREDLAALEFPPADTELIEKLTLG
jgi:8-oxo-dGTP diphosphatase